ncbi:CACTA en-spm transposon protein [Cucumis melo var. makuwa]|uniref:CACTA en-spm transposon protein n=1 Tax=Cucumis melo var. makuwa TaxID=1194695 RepID=A0A5A7TA75_CUCMM|nr:CACTA en-spm transposon protein [Cucumis melo var. makuwa]
MASGMDTLVFDITRHASGIVNTILDVVHGPSKYIRTLIMLDNDSDIPCMTSEMILTISDAISDSSGMLLAVSDESLMTSETWKSSRNFRGVSGVPLYILISALYGSLCSLKLALVKSLGDCYCLFRGIFSVHCLRLVDVGREYIKVIKGDLQHFFMLDFNNQAMNRFIEHQMLTSFKEFRADCHTHFKKYSDPEEARANPSHMLINQMLERYLKLFWIDDRATKKVLVEDPSSSPIRWPVLVVPQPCVRNSR